MPFKVAVVGAGISGLCTALALHQAGHTVHVFEKSRFAGEVGSAVLITPNAERVLCRLGVDFKKARADSVEYFKVFDAISLQPLSDVALLDPKEEFGAPLYTVHRVDLLNELLRLASGVNVQLGVKVVGADAEKGIITFEDETEYTADLIVAADGVHSILRSEVLRDRHVVQPNHSGMSTFRFMIHTSEIEHSSHFQELQKMRGNGCCLFADTKKPTEHHMQRSR